MSDTLAYVILGLAIAAVLLLSVGLWLTVRVSGRALSERHVAVRSVLALQEIRNYSAGHNEENAELKQVHEMSLHALDDVRGIGLKKLLQDESGAYY